MSEELLPPVLYLQDWCAMHAREEGELGDSAFFRAF